MANTAPGEIQNLDQEIKPVSSGWPGNLESWHGQSQVNWAGDANTDVEKAGRRKLLAWLYELFFPNSAQGPRKICHPCSEWYPTSHGPFVLG